MQSFFLDWSGLYLIKTRTLIVACVLLYGEDQFVQFLTRLTHPEQATGNNGTNANEPDNNKACATQETEHIKKTVQEFFDKKMPFSKAILFILFNNGSAHRTKGFLLF